MLKRGTSYFDCEHLYCLQAAGFTGGSSCFFASRWRETFLYQKKGITIQYRNLNTEGKRRACLGAKLRYARNRDSRRRQVYLKVLPTIRNPRPCTLEQYGIYCAEEGYVDEFGTLLCRCSSPDARENSETI